MNPFVEVSLVKRVKYEKDFSGLVLQIRCNTEKRELLFFIDLIHNPIEKF